MSNGFVIGKFYPPHAGHHYLIDTAAEQCDRLLVMILWSEQESIWPHLRKRWLEQRHPHVTVVTVQDEYAPDYESDAVWRNHINVIAAGFPPEFTGYNLPEIVFGSEPYVDELARRLVMRPVKVDVARSMYPVSGTAVRDDPEHNWHFLSAPVKQWFTKRIVVVGAESTGTTTLTQALARLYDTSWVPEYGRLFSQGVGLGHNWTIDDLQHIAISQQQAEDYMASVVHKPLLFCDTDAGLATRLWDEFLTGNTYFKAPVLDKPPDAYILTSPADIAWEDDGTREGEGFRWDMHHRFYHELNSNNLDNIPWIQVDGTRSERMWDAMNFVNRIMALGWKLNDPLG